MRDVDVAIAGAGIIGLSCALELSRRGHRVAVFDRGPAMREASWAAAGMLAAHDPENPAALLPLSRRSLELYPAFLERVGALAGQTVAFRTREALQAIQPPASALSNGRLLSHAEAVRRLPGLRAQDLRFLLLDEWSLDPRDLCAALPRAVQAAGVSLHEHTPVQGISGHGAAGAPEIEVRVSNGVLRARAFVNAAGAWASALLNPKAHPAAKDSAAVSPRKGQMVLVRLANPSELAIVLRTPEIYLVPRGDGRVLIGATVEEAGFDKSLREEATRQLMRRAAELWPPIAQAQVIDGWTGLRPATPDALPILGAEQGEGRSFLATGHFRNGILLAPATAELVASLIAGEAPAVDAAPFAPGRFALAS